MRPSTICCEVLEIEPQAVVHDLHPDFYSTRFAARFARTRAVPLVGVQHHHAHIAAVLAEHGVRGPVLGLALDGVGLGVDGTAWGGELLRVDGARCERLGHLARIALPGGDRAAHEPWRMAAAALHLMGRGERDRGAVPAAGRGARSQQMLLRDLHCPMTSSMGRWFDAAAGLLGVRAAAGVRRAGGDAARRAGGAPRCSDRAERRSSRSSTACSTFCRWLGVSRTKPIARAARRSSTRR